MKRWVGYCFRSNSVRLGHSSVLVGAAHLQCCGPVSQTRSLKIASCEADGSEIWAAHSARFVLLPSLLNYPQAHPAVAVVSIPRTGRRAMVVLCLPLRPCCARETARAIVDAVVDGRRVGAVAMRIPATCSSCVGSSGLVFKLKNALLSRMCRFDNIPGSQLQGCRPQIPARRHDMRCPGNPHLPSSQDLHDDAGKNGICTSIFGYRLARVCSLVVPLVSATTNQNRRPSTNEYATPPAVPQLSSQVRSTFHSQDHGFEHLR